MTLEEIKQEMHEAWIKIDETSWNERSQHPSPLVVCDFLDSFAEKAHALGEAVGREEVLNAPVKDSYKGKLWSKAIQIAMTAPFPEVAMQHLLNRVAEAARSTP